MNYNLEHLMTSLGEGIRIEDNRCIQYTIGGWFTLPETIKNLPHTYEEIKTQKDFVLRLLRTPYEKEGKLYNDQTRGIFFTPFFKDSEKNYNQFKLLTDRLNEIPGINFPNSEEDFMKYLSLGEERTFLGGNTKLKILLKDKYKSIGNSADKFISSRAHLAGASVDLAALAGSVGAISYFNPSWEIYLGGIGIAALIEFLGGMFIMAGIDSFSEWSGPMHSLGFFPYAHKLSNKLKSSNYLLEKFIEDNQKLKELGNNLQNQKEYSRRILQAEKNLDVLEDLFSFTFKRKGISIEYQNSNREEVLKFFEYLLKENVPYDVKSRKTEQSLSKSSSTDLINPWEIEIPKVEETNGIQN